MQESVIYYVLFNLFCMLDGYWLLSKQSLFNLYDKVNVIVCTTSVAGNRLLSTYNPTLTILGSGVIRFYFVIFN